AGDKAKMTIPATGTPEVQLPMKLIDTREPSAMTDYEYCRVEDTAVYPIQTEIWYAAPPPSPIGGTLSIFGVADVIAIPALGHETPETAYAQGQRYKLTHGQDLGEAGGVRVLRNFIRLQIFPYNNNHATLSAGTTHNREAPFRFTLTGPPG